MLAHATLFPPGLGLRASRARLSVTHILKYVFFCNAALVACTGNSFQLGHAHAFVGSYIQHQGRIETIGRTIRRLGFGPYSRRSFHHFSFLCILVGDVSLCWCWLCYRRLTQNRFLCAVFIRAITDPTGTTSFILYRTLSITPSAVLGTSLSTLSVAMSSTVSSIFTLSPGFLCHFKMVASVILSPSLGIIKSTVAIISFYKLLDFVLAPLTRLHSHHSLCLSATDREGTFLKGQR